MNKYTDILKKNGENPEYYKNNTINIINTTNTNTNTNTNTTTNNNKKKIKVDEFDANIKNPDNEFEREYLSKIFDLKLEFKDLIENESLPFMDKLHNINYTFSDYIKYNSDNFGEIINRVKHDNDEYLKWVEEEKNEENIYEDYD